MMSKNPFGIVLRVDDSRVHPVLQAVMKKSKLAKKKVAGEWCYYYDFPAAFDIETTNVIIDGEKRESMYIWQFGIAGNVFYGRTWGEFLNFCRLICDVFMLHDTQHLVVYVHNLAYEFQHIRRFFNWSKVFARETRSPMYAITDTGIEFKCSYYLSNESLEVVGRNLVKYKVEKATGKLDYYKPRNWKTPLTPDEMEYCINDVLVLMAYIQEQKEIYGHIPNIPLTNTGRVRRKMKNSIRRSPDRRKYYEMMAGLTLEADEYLQLKRAFQGGFTHANYKCVGKVLKDVHSMDFTSSYPAVMVSELFPMSKGRKLEGEYNPADLQKPNKLYVYDVVFTDLEPAIGVPDSPLSYSKCLRIRDYCLNNGRVLFAGAVMTTITSVDYEYYSRFYDYTNAIATNVIEYDADYLPKPIVETILELYAAKTTLKGVEGKEAEYMNSKAMLNSCYGMMVTDIAAPEITYDDEWGEIPLDLASAIEEYNSKKGRFLYYPWGVFVTAYARRNLFTGILELGDDYVYSDTDSCKFQNLERHKAYFDRYDSIITAKIDRALALADIDIEASRPVKPNGKPAQMGVWDYEGVYSRFKTLGAKRYMVEKDGKVNFTVSGLSKVACMPYLYATLKDNDAIFNAFEDGMYIPASATVESVTDDGKRIQKDYYPTGKLSSFYIDEPYEYVLTDYNGVSTRQRELTGVHMGPASHMLSLSESFRALLSGRIAYAV